MSIWKKWSITDRAATPASSAARPTAASVGAIDPGPPGSVKLDRWTATFIAAQGPTGPTAPASRAGGCLGSVTESSRKARALGVPVVEHGADLGVPGAVGLPERDGAGRAGPEDQQDEADGQGDGEVTAAEARPS